MIGSLMFLIGTISGMLILTILARIATKEAISDKDKEVLEQAIEKLNEDPTENNRIIQGLFKIMERK